MTIKNAHKIASATDQMLVRQTKVKVRTLFLIFFSEGQDWKSGFTISWLIFNFLIFSLRTGWH